MALAALCSSAALAEGKAQTDSLVTLREKLAIKLGAQKASDAGATVVVRASAKVDAGDGPVPAKPSSAGHGRGHAAATRPGATQGVHGAGHEPHWSYSGPGGPSFWGQLKPEFAKCASGTRQSPIDIREGLALDLDPIEFDYRPSQFAVLDNGHTVQVNVGAGNTITVMGRRFELLQFHFHRPSEERIEGRQFDMVAHLVHKDFEGRLAVVAVLLDKGSAHPLVQAVWNNLPLERGEPLTARAPIDLAALLPADKRYYTYMGSLTTPPCSEGVLWLVMQQPVMISPEQIGVFARLYPMNARPVQSAAGRMIKQSSR